MGTHPIFESDFDCLTDCSRTRTSNLDRTRRHVNRETNTMADHNVTSSSTTAAETRRPRPPPTNQPAQPQVQAPTTEEQAGLFWPKQLPIINKDIFRNMVWDTLDSANLVRFPRPCKGRIPNFHGHNRAANRLSKTKEYVEARTVKVNSSLAQEKVRYLSLWDRKMLHVPCPTTQLQDGFMWEIDGNDITDKKCKLAANKRGLKSFGSERRLRDLKGKHYDLVIVGSVAVCPNTGARLGQGTGFGDLEWGILCELGVVDETTIVATTVHDVQVRLLPQYIFQTHDLPVDIICTPGQTIRIRNRRSRPSGLDWNALSREYLELPVIRDLRRLQRQKTRYTQSSINHSVHQTSGGGSTDSSATTTSEEDYQHHDHPTETQMDSLCATMASMTKVN